MWFRVCLKLHLLGCLQFLKLQDLSPSQVIVDYMKRCIKNEIKTSRMDGFEICRLLLMKELMRYVTWLYEQMISDCMDLRVTMPIKKVLVHDVISIQYDYKKKGFI